MVERACRSADEDMVNLADPDCADAMYDYLEMFNEEEWWLTLEMSWNNMGWLAVFGPFFQIISLISIFGAFFGIVPDIDMDWDNMDIGSKWWMYLVWWTSGFGAPTLFVLT